LFVNNEKEDMDKERLKEIMLDQKDVFNRQRYLIQRDLNYETIINSRQVIVISGVRRCGKSSLMYLLKEEMRLNEADYCYFNFEDERISADVADLEKIYTLHIELYGKEPVLFLDEIQNVRGWEKFINRIYEKEAKIFVTGSNGRLLSSEIATSLTDRNKVVKLFPFSFSEFLRFLEKGYNLDGLTTQQKALLQKDFNKYLEIGGFPLVVKENDLEIINSYFQDILYRDIVSRYRLSQVNEIKEIGLYFVSNIGKIFSYSTLQKVTGIKSLSTVKDYLDYYEQSFLFFYLKKFDYSVRKQIMNPKKVYTIDPAFANRLGFKFSENKGRVLENIIFIDLIRRNQDIYYYSGKNECDFLVREGTKIVRAIQVCYALNSSNYERELNGLKEAMDVHNVKNGFLIVNDVEIPVSDIGPSIRLITPWSWLMASKNDGLPITDDG
jgi:uncharacterized protein